MDGGQELTMYETCLYHIRTNRAWRMMVDRCLEKYQLNMMEWLLLGTVSSGPTVGFNMSALARLLDVTMPQVTVLNAHLIKQKLVKQKADKHDRRNRYVIITGKGKGLIESIEEDIKQAMKKWLHELPDDQLDSYKLTIKQISETALTEPDKEKAQPLSADYREIKLK